MANILGFPFTPSDLIEARLEALKQGMAGFPAGLGEPVRAPPVTPLGAAASSRRNRRWVYLSLREPRYGQLLIRWLHACDKLIELPRQRKKA